MHKAAHGRKRVVQPRAVKAEREDERGEDMAQGFVKIRAVLFGYMFNPIGKGCTQGWIKGIEIANHPVWPVTPAHEHIRAAICRNKGWRAQQRGFKISARNLTTANKGHAMG